MPFTPVPDATVLVMCPNVWLVIELLGLENHGVLVKLNVSPRNWRLNLSLIFRSLNKDRFSWKKPGPLMAFRPVFPKTGPTGWAKLEVLNHGLPTLIPCRI